MSRPLLWVPPAAVAAAIYLLSSFSRIAGSEQVWDKLAHVVVFAILAALLLRATHGGRRLLRPGAVALAGGLALAWGILDEVHQSFVPGRFASALDVAADAVGIALAIAVWAVRTREVGRDTSEVGNL